MMNTDKYNKIFQYKFCIDLLTDFNLQLEGFQQDLQSAICTPVNDAELNDDSYSHDFNAPYEILNNIKEQVLINMQHWLGIKTSSMPEDLCLEKMEAINRTMLYVETLLANKVAISDVNRSENSEWLSQEEIGNYFYYPIPINIIVYFEDEIPATEITWKNFKCRIRKLHSQGNKNHKPIIYGIDIKVDEIGRTYTIIQERPIYTRECNLPKSVQDNYSNTLIALYREGLLDWEDMLEMKAIEYRWDKYSLYFIVDATQTEGDKT